MSQHSNKPVAIDALREAALVFLRAALVASSLDEPCTCETCVGHAASVTATLAALAKTSPGALAADAIALATSCIDDAAAQLYTEADVLRNAPPVAPVAPWPTLQ